MMKQYLFRLVGVASLTLLSACSLFHSEPSDKGDKKPLHLSQSDAPSSDVVPAGGQGFSLDTPPVEVPVEMPVAPAPEAQSVPAESAPMVCPACKASPCVCPPPAPVPDPEQQQAPVEQQQAPVEQQQAPAPAAAA